MTESLLPKIIHILYMIDINEILDHIVPFLEHIDQLRDAILVLHIDQVLIPETTTLQNILLHIDLLPDHKLLDFLDLALMVIQKITLIQYKTNR